MNGEADNSRMYVYMHLTFKELKQFLLIKLTTAPAPPGIRALCLTKWTTNAERTNGDLPYQA